LQADQLLRERSHPIDVLASPTKVHPQVAAIGPTEVRERLRERGNVSFRTGSVSSPGVTTPMRRTRSPCCARTASGHAAEERDRLAAINARE
jgi:hypothetical protein